MQPAPEGEITRVLRELSGGRAEAREQLAYLVYDQLHRMAAREMNGERRDHTLQPTALVNEAYCQLVDDGNRTYQDRFHFFAVAGQIMRRILVDHARRHRAEKRGGGRARVELDENMVFSQCRAEELLALDAALDRLARVNQRQSQVVELRFFSGLTEDEIAEVIGVNPRTVKRDWKVARAWLHAELTAVLRG